MHAIAKLTPDANTRVNFGIASIRTREGHQARRFGWDKSMRLEPVTIAGKETYMKVAYKADGKVKNKTLITDADMQAVDWMINQ